MIAIRSTTRTDVWVDVALCLMWPGLGQLNQRRYAIGASFAMVGLGLAVALAAAPQWRGPLLVALGVVAVLNVGDAIRHARRHGDA